MKLFHDFKNLHEGKKFLVLGCGESAVHANQVRDAVSIGVNDIQRIFTPEYLLIVNDRKSFSPGRWEWVENTRASYIFTHLDIFNDRPNVVKVSLGRYRRPTLGSDRLDYSNNSPYMAVLLAYYMGAKKIGILGVDFTPNHFFASTGEHPLTAKIQDINADYVGLHTLLKDEGVELVNLSLKSILTIPKETPQEF